MFILEWRRIITVNSHQAVFPSADTLYVLKWRDKWTVWSTGNFDALNRLLLLLTTFEFHFISRSRQIKAACINEDFTGLFCEGNRVSCLYICDVNQPNRYWLLDTKHLRCIDIDFVFWPGAIQDRHYS